MSLARILIAVAATLALVAGWSWWTGDAQRIARRFDALAEEVQKRPGEGNLAAAFKAEQAAGFFAEPFLFRARQFDFETDDRRALTRALAAYRLRSERIAPTILHREINVDAEARTAKMELVVRFAGGLRGNAGEAYRFQLNWVEQEGLWRIGFADLVEILPASVL